MNRLATGSVTGVLLLTVVAVYVITSRQWFPSSLLCMRRNLRIKTDPVQVLVSEFNSRTGTTPKTNSTTAAEVPSQDKPLSRKSSTHFRIGKVNPSIQRGPLRFHVCEGLTNQRIAILHGILVGLVTQREVILPMLESSYNANESTQIQFSDVYDLSNLVHRMSNTTRILAYQPMGTYEYASSVINPNRNITAKNQRYTTHQWQSLSNMTRGILDIGCAFNSIKVEKWMVEVMWEIDHALIYNAQIQKQIDVITSSMPGGYTALHYRVEDDWIEHCKKWKGDNCFSNTDQIVNVFHLERVPRSRPVYVAGAFSNEFIKNSTLNQLSRHGYNLITKDSILLDLNVKKNIVSQRDVLAAIDYGVCLASTLFVGNSVSTFSALLELRRSQEQLSSFHYNGGNIPLQAYTPVFSMMRFEKRVKWVFAMVLNNEISTSYIEMAKVAVLSANRNTLLDPVCIVYINKGARGSAKVSGFLRWMHAARVTIIVHRPLWADHIIEDAARGRTQQNTRHSPLYASSDALIATFLRIDIPILGFIDDYVIYTDVDVMFLKNIALADFEVLPKYYMMGTELKITNSKASGTSGNHYGNAGVMIYNVRGMQRTYEAFLENTFSAKYRRNGLHYGIFGPGDQGAYNAFYRGKKLGADIEPYAFFNWRPYWKGRTHGGQEVALVHWQGPKPSDYFAYLKDPASVDRKGYVNLLSNCNRDAPLDTCWQWNRMWQNLAVEAKEMDHILNTSVVNL